MMKSCHLKKINLKNVKFFKFSNLSHFGAFGSQSLELQISLLDVHHGWVAAASASRIRKFFWIVARIREYAATPLAIRQIAAVPPRKMVAAFGHLGFKKIKVSRFFTGFYGCGFFSRIFYYVTCRFTLEVWPPIQDGSGYHLKSVDN